MNIFFEYIKTNWDIAISFLIVFAGVVKFYKNFTGRILLEDLKKVIEYLTNNKRWQKVILIVGVSIMLPSIFLLGKHSAKANSTYVNKTRVVIMLPTGDIVQSAYQDGMRQLYGFAEFINDKDGERYSDDYEFIPVSHAMDSNIAKDIIIRETNKGTKYFISTMSKVNEPLSKNFDNIISQCKYSGPKPILICTVSSSSKIKLSKNSVYRFYIRSREEAKVLANEASRLDFKSATYIVVDDPYGHDMVDEFRKNWPGTNSFPEGIFIKYGDDIAEIEKKIKKMLLADNANHGKAILVAHYGKGLDNIISVLSNLHIKGAIFATSSLGISDWQEPVKNQLKAMNWYTCVPDYKRKDESKKDVVKNFMTFTLSRLVQALNTLKNDPTKNFDECWKQAEVSLDLEITWDSNGDSIIPLKVVDKSYFEK